MGIFDLFKNKKSTRQSTLHPKIEEPTIFYHEDDYRQVEIVPSDSLADLVTESKKVDDFGQKHFDGSGYTDIYVRNEEIKTELKQRLINPNDLEQRLVILGLVRIPKVLTGYGQTYRELHKDCMAFGNDYSAFYYDFKDDIVQNIWLTNHWSMDREKLANCLHQIGKQWKLMLQDWNLTATIDLNDKKAIDDYLGTYDEKNE